MGVGVDEEVCPWEKQEPVGKKGTSCQPGKGCGDASIEEICPWEAGSKSVESGEGESRGEDFRELIRGMIDVLMEGGCVGGIPDRVKSRESGGIFPPDGGSLVSREGWGSSKSGDIRVRNG